MAIMAVMHKESFRVLATCAWFGHVTADALQTLKVMKPVSHASPRIIAHEHMPNVYDTL